MNDGYASIDLDALGQVVDDLERTLDGLRHWLPGLERDFSYFGVETTNLARLAAAKRELETVVPDLRERHRRAETLLVHQEAYGLHGDDGVVHFPGDLLDGDEHVSHQIHDQAGRSPEDVHEWWAGLDETEREYLVEYHPYLVGRLDGVPIASRDRANRTVLDHEIERLHTELGELIQKPGSDTSLYLDGRPVSPTDVAGLLPRHQEASRIAERLGGLSVVKERLDQSEPPAFLIDLSTHGFGRAVVSVGNPDEAGHVATYVPGTGSRLDERIRTDIQRTDIMFEDAQEAGQGSTAVVMWLGYDAPQDVVLDVESPSRTAWSPDAAEAGAPRLRGFQEGLRVTHAEGDSHNTLLGHSYGTTVIGHAAKEGDVPVDNLVFVASPGVGVDTVSELGIDPENVFATTALGDPISFAPHRMLGPQPTSSPFDVVSPFGATDFSSDIGGHSSYWNEGNQARNNLAYIVTGQHDRVQ
ncbi:hypothetical protein EF847_15610 [Actinobacteria bacterium YIM 96077]|uniref:DUF1023 domain-containing protein n=1 Tax=Phytoactinopolyspora halophila TaxID=1981511 RepID=A0A329QU50_9ACTN|nr:alpha/beta hydrolase [Phytoactinopolyspora halophila]AYY13912.1 hypothetical protein EF847_15610 [Actinobacteria bacterium YIM 96077]RAW15546.1 hypothetical protein DPM12_07730 [Phytoactinopolyspora halophila]